MVHFFYLDKWRQLCVCVCVCVCKSVNDCMPTRVFHARMHAPRVSFLHPTVTVPHHQISLIVMTSKLSTKHKRVTTFAFLLASPPLPCYIPSVHLCVCVCVSLYVCVSVCTCMCKEYNITTI